MKTFKALSLAVVLLGGLTSLTQATVVYNNSTNDLGVRFSFTNGLGGATSLQYGDEIVLAGSERFLTNFSFEYYLQGISGPNRESRVTFQLNDGTPFNTYLTPGTTFYDSGWFFIGGPTTRSTVEFISGVDFPINGLYMPVLSNFTFTVQFRGLDANDNIGVDLYNPPVVGAAYNDFWAYNGSSWSLQTNNAVPVNFGAVFQATVPEPSAVALVVLGGLGWFAILRRSRKD